MSADKTRISTATRIVRRAAGGSARRLSADICVLGAGIAGVSAALEAARQSGKPVFVSFTGYACTNCHWMKANMFPRPEIQAALGKFVLVELYVDGTDPASEANQRILESRFNIIAIPFYAVIRPDDTVVETFPRYTRNAAEFESFLVRTAGAVSVASAGGAAEPAS